MAPGPPTAQRSSMAPTTNACSGATSSTVPAAATQAASSVSSTSTSGWRQNHRQQHLPRIKICFLGCSSVGKTQLIRRFVHGEFEPILGGTEQWTSEEALFYRYATGRESNERESDVPLSSYTEAPSHKAFRSMQTQSAKTSRSRSRTTPAQYSRQSQTELLFKSTSGSGSLSSRSNTPALPLNSARQSGSRPSSTIGQGVPAAYTSLSHLPQPLSIQTGSSTAGLFSLAQPSPNQPNGDLNSSAVPPAATGTKPSPLALSTERTMVSFNGRYFELDLIELPEISTLPRNNAQEWALFKGTASLRTAHAYILVFDLSLPATFQYVKALHDQLCDLRPMSGIPVWVMGNKADLCIPLLNSSRTHHHHHHHHPKTKKITPLAYELPLGVSSMDETVMHSLLHPHLHSVGVTGYGAATSGAPPPCPYDDLTPTFKDLGAIVRKQWKCSYLECSAKYNWHITAVFREIVKNVQATETFQADNYSIPIISGTHHRSISAGDNAGRSAQISSTSTGGTTLLNQNQYHSSPTRRPKMCVIF